MSSPAAKCRGGGGAMVCIRRWKAKEGVQIDRETQTLATITIQNISGFIKTGGNDRHGRNRSRRVSRYLQTRREHDSDQPAGAAHRQQRSNLQDASEKYNAVIKEIREAHVKGQPVLVGTVSVEASELLSRMLKRDKIPHNVLNAKFHMQEAEIVARAGQPGTVTFQRTWPAAALILSLVPGYRTGRVDGSRDGASRGAPNRSAVTRTCARQGDPGASRFYVSFEDDLMRNFGAADRMTKIMERFGLEEGQELEHRWLNKSVETAQKRVEQRNYLIRKRTLDFDDVMTCNAKWFTRIAMK